MSENRPATTNRKNVLEIPMPDTSDGKTSPITKLVSHSTTAATPMPKPRIRIGKISDSISQVTGDIAPCWKARKVTVMASTA
ncbi:hypothetical protein SCHAM137S_01879 [Streptomyces chartreusis]